jgi:hypothetical protein
MALGAAATRTLLVLRLYSDGVDEEEASNNGTTIASWGTHSVEQVTSAVLMKLVGAAGSTSRVSSSMTVADEESWCISEMMTSSETPSVSSAIVVTPEDGKWVSCLAIEHVCAATSTTTADDAASTGTALPVAGGAISAAAEISAGLGSSIEQMVCVGAAAGTVAQLSNLALRASIESQIDLVNSPMRALRNALASSSMASGGAWYKI